MITKPAKNKSFAKTAEQQAVFGFIRHILDNIQSTDFNHSVITDRQDNSHFQD